MNTPLDPVVVDFVCREAGSQRYADLLRERLVELVAINTAPDNDLAGSAAREGQLFDVIERELRAVIGDAVTIERPAIDPAIGNDPAYSPPGYAADSAGAVPPCHEVYAGRNNLVAWAKGATESAPAVILHAHVDVVAPWFPPRVEGERVFGRGACDNKAQVALLLAQMRLMKEIAEKLGRTPARGLALHLAIDEEIGGNGSLALAMDRRFDDLPVLMLESSDLTPYCAHRGAVYYRIALSVGDAEELTAVEMFPFVVLELEAEGKRIKEETNHPLFTPRHVQTNQGVLGCYGRHPGNVCDHVAIEIVTHSGANPERVGMKLMEFLDEALAQYCRLYGDKRRERDPATGNFKVARHYDLKVNPTAQAQHFRIDVHGKSGHMAAVADCDNAITKAAYLLAALLRIASNFPKVRAHGVLADAPPDHDRRRIVIEGGQGFTPCHTMTDVQSRLTAAARRGVEQWCKLRGRHFEEGMIEISFDRLHNDAYADAPDSAPMQALHAAFDAVGLDWPVPQAWITSCDARLYHHRGHPVAIFGAGKLEAAHSDGEYVDIPELQKALAVSTLATWALTA